MAFRKFGGLNYAATNNIVRNHFSNNDNPTISNQLGDINSKIVCASHLDMSLNSILNISTLYFSDGTVQTTAYTGGGGVGPQGPQGNPGSVGRTGPAGPTGLQGSTGPAGPTGLQGSTGPAGQTGSQGSQGNHGYQGYQGDMGPTGLQGSTGSQGTQGYQGYQGDIGPTGLQGSTGNQGNQGNQGYQGVVGPTGTATDLLTQANTWTAINTFNTDIIVSNVSSIFNYGLTVGTGGGGVTSNTAVGYQTLYSNTNGSKNTSVGNLSMNSNTTGTNNTVLGESALKLNSTGDENVAIGSYSLYNNTNSNNVAVGYLSLNSNTTGSQNVAVGPQSLLNTIAGTNNTAIGYNAGCTGDCSFTTAIGYNAAPTANNQIMMGTSADAVVIPGSLTTDGPSNTSSGSYVMTNTVNPALYEGTINYDVDANTFGIMYFSISNYAIGGTVGGSGAIGITNSWSTTVISVIGYSPNVGIGNNVILTPTTGQFSVTISTGSPINPSADVTLLYSYVRLY